MVRILQKLLGSDIKGDENISVNADLNLDLNETHNILVTVYFYSGRI